MKVTSKKWILNDIRATAELKEKPRRKKDSWRTLKRIHTTQAMDLSCFDFILVCK